MMEIIKNSFLYKFGLKTYEIYKKGAIHGAITTVKTHYPTSKLKVLWENFLAKESAVYFSNYSKFSKFVVKILEQIGDIYNQSIVRKIFDFFVNLYMSITRNSLFFKPLHMIGVKGFLLIIFAMYLPIDYILRSILVIPVLSSLWDELLLILFFVTVLYRIATKKSTLAQKITPLDSYLFLYFTVGLFLMCYVSPVFSIAVAGYRAVFQYMLWFFVVVRLIEDDKDFKILYNSLIVIIIPLGLHGIYQYIMQVPNAGNWVTSTESFSGTRAYSIIGSPNILGCIIVMFTPMIAAYVYSAKSIFIKIIAAGTTGLMAIGLLVTFSKGAWIGAVVAVIVFALFVDKRILALLLAAITGIVIAVPSVVDRITYLFTEDYAIASAAGGRTMRWAFGMDLLSQGNEIFGFGLGRFGGAVAMQNQVLEQTNGFSYFYLDNYYLKTLVEMGYLGLSFYVLLLLAFIVLSVKAIGRVRNTSIYIPSVGVFSGMIGVLTHCYTENIFEVPYMLAYFWAMAAMLMYVGFIRKKEN